jgi:hypothetical protein
MSIAVAMDDRRDRIEEGERVGAGRRADRLGERRRQRAGGDDGRPEAGRASTRSRTSSTLGWAASAAVTAAEKPSRSTARALPAGTRWASAARMISEPSARISAWSRPTALLLGIVGAEAVRADQFGKAVALVRRRRLARAAHFGEAHLHAGFGKLPGGLRAGEAAADDVDVDRHSRESRNPAFLFQAGGRSSSGTPAFAGVTEELDVKIFTIGYEGATQDEVVATLQKAGVEQVIDVRAVPLSRRPGFSKNVLAAGLKEAGIDYVLLKALGTPPAGREAARKGRHDEMKRIYAAQLETPEAGMQAAQMVALAEEKPSALLCFERDPAHCHRTLLRETVLPDWQAVDLYA